MICKASSSFHGCRFLNIVVCYSLLLPAICVVALSTRPCTTANLHASDKVSHGVGRRDFLVGSSTVFCTATTTIAPIPASAKCQDIDSCREIGDRKVEQDLKENPITVLQSGVRYKQLKKGFGDDTVKPSGFVDIIYSISTGGGIYMYSKGFGYEKDETIGLDSYRVTLGTGNLPVGVEQALIGSKKGERRRIEVPPNVGFETSDWKPEPTTRNGKQRIKNYQTLLNGVGSTRPPFPAPTIWDVEILSFR